MGDAMSGAMSGAMGRLARWLAVGLVAAALGLPAGLNAQPTGKPLPHPDAEGLTTRQRFEALLARAEHRQAELETLEATFEQRKESPMLLEPEGSTGTVLYRAPDRVRWDFDPPTATTVLVGDEEMLTWYRDQGVVERRQVGDTAARIVRMLGPGASLQTLQGYFDMTASFPEDPSEPYRLVLDPRTRRVERRVRRLELEIDRELFVPVFVRIEDAEGTVTELRFADVQVNGELAPERFELELPEGVEIRELGGVETP